MLLHCPECDLMVSDKASVCPHCGFPLTKKEPRKRHKISKHRRLPNGFGQISEIHNKNLRNPFRAMITVGYTSEGRPICKLLKPISYFRTYNEAYEALVEYNKNPYELSNSITVQELYDRWSKEYFKTLKSSSSYRTIESAWAYCENIKKLSASEIRARHLKGCIDNATAKIKGNVKAASADTKSRMKSLFNLMFDYAVEYEIVDKNYARTFSLFDKIIDERNQTKRNHLSFTSDEMEKLWANINLSPTIEVMLFQCYSGFRPQELGLIRIADVDLDKNIIVGGMKTEAGIDRTVPIHPRIRFIVEKWYSKGVSSGSEYLFTCEDSRTHKANSFLTYDKYQYRFNKIVETLKLNPDHRSHDGRKHFITMAKKYKVDEYAIKYIVGHSISDITEKVYTDRDLPWLQEEISKIL